MPEKTDQMMGQANMAVGGLTRNRDLRAEGTADRPAIEIPMGVVPLARSAELVPCRPNAFRRTQCTS